MSYDDDDDDNNNNNNKIITNKTGNVSVKQLCGAFV
jgi:hypothetical protein